MIIHTLNRLLPFKEIAIKENRFHCTQMATYRFTTIYLHGHEEQKVYLLDSKSIFRLMVNEVDNDTKFLNLSSDLFLLR